MFACSFYWGERQTGESWPSWTTSSPQIDRALNIHNESPSEQHMVKHIEYWKFGVEVRITTGYHSKIGQNLTSKGAYILGTVKQLKHELGPANVNGRWKSANGERPPSAAQEMSFRTNAVVFN
ncbi:hypothetical protein EVAR_19419_1 [Eumeta japonica]|uniref:Uncharacterized protein n=1 Tax=Eumeta variegata TaxID=151549 RepID=A0A4C1TRM3_EUMVA|nr:hypothetical protein EVAR_19419_1 [Eumeta japonica]